MSTNKVRSVQEIFNTLLTHIDSKYQPTDGWYMCNEVGLAVTHKLISFKEYVKVAKSIHTYLSLPNGRSNSIVVPYIQAFQETDEYWGVWNNPKFCYQSTMHKLRFAIFSNWAKRPKSKKARIALLKSVITYKD